MARAEYTLYVPMTLVKKAVRIPDETDEDDDLLQQALDGACDRIEQTCRRFFWRGPEATTQTIRTAGRVLRDPDCDGDLLLVDDIAAEDTIVLVETGRRGQEWQPFTDYEVESPILPGWPITALRGTWRTPKVRITAVPGWPQIPASIAQAGLLQATRLYRRKDSPQGVIGSADWGASRVSRVDPDVADMLETFVLPR